MKVVLCLLHKTRKLIINKDFMTVLAGCFLNNIQAFQNKKSSNDGWK